MTDVGRATRQLNAGESGDNVGMSPKIHSFVTVGDPVLRLGLHSHDMT
jgi:hypothetical protein